MFALLKFRSSHQIWGKFDADYEKQRQIHEEFPSFATAEEK